MKSDRYKRKCDKIGGAMAKATLEKYKESFHAQRPGSNRSEESLAEHLLDQARSEVEEGWPEGHHDDPHQEMDRLLTSCSSENKSMTDPANSGGRWRGSKNSASSSSSAGDPRLYYYYRYGSRNTSSRSTLEGTTLADSSAVSSSVRLTVGSDLSRRARSSAAGSGAAAQPAYLPGPSSVESPSNWTTACTLTVTGHGEVVYGRTSDNTVATRASGESHITTESSSKPASRTTGSQVDEDPAWAQHNLNARHVHENFLAQSPPGGSPPHPNTPFS